MVIYEKLKLIREVFDLKQSEIAEKLGITGQKTYSTYEKGDRGISIELAATIADCFDVDIYWLVKDDFVNSVISYMFEDFRRRKQLTIAEFAEKVGKPALFIERIEKKELVPSRLFITNVAKIFSVDEKKLTGEIGYSVLDAISTDQAKLQEEKAGLEQINFSLLKTIEGFKSENAKLKDEKIALLEKNAELYETIESLRTQLTQAQESLKKPKPTGPTTEKSAMR